ncbi:hypothetical protein ACS0TY_010947 [Phlomoides rotata]
MLTNREGQICSTREDLFLLARQVLLVFTSDTKGTSFQRMIVLTVLIFQKLNYGWEKVISFLLIILVQDNIIAMARICRRNAEVLLVVEEIILEIVFMLSVIINRYRNTGQFRGLNVENVRRYRMADRIPQQI